MHSLALSSLVSWFESSTYSATQQVKESPALPIDGKVTFTSGFAIESITSDGS